MKQKLLFTIFILASAGSLYGQGWTFNDGTLNVTGQIWGQSYESSTSNTTPYSDYHGQIKTIIISDNITYVGRGAFTGCTVAERLVVGKGVKTYMYNAFYFPKSTLKTIEWNAANAGLVDQYDGYMSKYNQGPFGVREVWMEIDDCNYAANAETIIFGPDVVSIPNYFAYFMKKLKKVEFGAKVTSIGKYAFVGITPSTVLIARMPNPSSVTLGDTDSDYNPFPASASDRNKITLKVPAAYVNKYKAANIWKDFNIVALENSTEDEPSETQTGVLVGEFSVSSTQKVHFSQGNLQYQASTNTWRFALNQYDYIGSANSNISSTYSGWIDLFGYGTSGWNSGFTAYRPYASNSYDGSYIDKDLTGAYENADWGVYNAISNGGNQAGLWRTLTGAEWKYLLQQRPNADIRLSVGKVNSVSGLILLPDDWVLPEGLTFTPKGSSYDSNKYNTTQWQKMENAGAVFLPAAGWRVIDEVRTTWSSGGIGLRGVYHGSSIADPSASTKMSYAITFYSDKIGGGINSRECGLSVRLVQDVLGYTITFVDADGNTIGTPQVVEPGQSATPPTPPTRADYNFAGWIGNYQNVTADATIYASYEHAKRSLLGIFSISDTETVLFSQGNLQYHATAGTHKCADGSTKQGVWRFAEHQWDYVGDDTNGTVYGNGVKSNNALISSTYNGWIDLFGWGTSGWESGANAYQPYSTSEVNSDYYPGGSAENSLIGAYQYADWGVYNAIFNGSNQHSLWRTLTGEQLGYIYSGRANAAMKRSTATINGITGYIFLPDMWVQPTGISFTADANDYSSNVYTLSQWKLMEENGAVFLPSAGFRRNGTIATSSLIMGDYWASTAYDTDCANRLMTREDKVLAGIESKEERHYGFSVRLIKDVICHTITFEANGGIIPTTGNMGKQFAVHKTSLSADQTYGTVTVRSGYSFFATMTNDCPTREGYVFEGWFDSAGEQVYDNTGSDIEGSYWSAAHNWKGSSDVTLYAHWTPLSYTITTDATNGTVTGGGTYDYGTNLQLTANPANCYQFTQWSDGNSDNPRPITVTGDATYTAEFSKIQYAVRFNNYDGTPLQNTNVDCGTMPEYTGETPTKPADEQYTYSFSGWDADIVAVTGEATYTAQFTNTLNKYAISFVNYDGTPLQSSEVEYGIVPQYNGLEPTKPADAQYIYTFAGWDKEVVAVTGDATYTAVFVSVVQCGTIETTDGITVWEDQLPYTWEGISFTTAVTETKTLQTSDGCDSIVTFTLRVLYRNITLQENEAADFYTQFATDYNGVTVTTATLNRQFTQGKWATLCLPFDVNKAMMMSLGLYNRVFALRYAQQLDDETIQMYFAPAKSIEAGKGYIVNAHTKLAQKTSFIFPNVTIDTDADNGDITALTGYNDGTGRGNLYLVGTLRTGVLQGSANGNTYLGLKDNVLYYPNSTTGTSVRAYRAIFRYENAHPDYPDYPAELFDPQRVRIIAEGETVTELEVMNGEEDLHEALPARKYIRNGLLFIERNGVTYTAQGQRID